MPTSAKERASILRALKAASPLVWDGEGPFINEHYKEYICDAIRVACNNNLINEYESKCARELIATRINHRFSLREWLEEDAGVPLKDLTPARVQAHRLAWLDLLIAEFSEPFPCPKKSTK